MKFGFSVSRRKRALASGTAVTVLAGTLVALAVHSKGFPISDVNLNDGSVWVTKNSTQLVARLNSQVNELDLGVVSGSTDQDLYQSASDVQVVDAGQRRVLIADVENGKFQTPVSVSDTTAVAAGRRTVAMLDEKSGSAWVRRADAIAGFRPADAPITTKIKPNGSVAVGTDGSAYFLDVETGIVHRFAPQASGALGKGIDIDLGGQLNSGAQLTVVGTTPVVWDPKAAGGGLLYVPGPDPIHIDGADEAALQQPGPNADSAYVATSTQLWKVPLSGGKPVGVSNIQAHGQPAAPVVVDGWVHAAWVDPGHKNYTRIPVDGGEGDYAGGQVPGLTAQASFVFRANRKVVVLNDIVGGISWMVQRPNLLPVNNWDSVDPRKMNKPTPDEKNSIEKSKHNRPPKARDDNFGARPGTTVTLPVTLNDADPDGDLLVVRDTPARDDRSGTDFALVGDATQVQARVAPNAKGTIDFRYTITDGHEGNEASTATVHLKIASSTTDDKPALIKGQSNTLTVASGRHASVNVLPAWIDPEGDPLTLTKAESKDGKVQFRPDGTIDFADDGKGGSTASISFSVQGGKAVASGSVAVTVVDPAKAKPTVVADHASGFEGRALLLQPTKNDIDPTGGQLQVPTMQIVQGAGASRTLDSAHGTATFTADKAGTYLLQYTALASNHVASESQIIRVDIKDRSGQNAPPVAAKDNAVVQQGRSALADLLANDVDPDGDVLVVQGLDVPTTGPCAGKYKASLINKRYARVESIGGLDQACQFSYALTDGRSSVVTGAVSVAGGKPTVNRNPVANADVVSARAGTLLTIPILADDSDPDGDKLTVNAADIIDAAELPVVTTGSDVRVLVPRLKTGGQRTFSYRVHDGQGGTAVATVTLNIKPDDPKINAAPQPPPIEDRTVQGQKVRVSVDLAGADPDGDPLSFTGVAQSPTLGRITASGTNWFEYEPFESAGGHASTGTDSFKVTVADPYGQTATADVRIGVGARADVNQLPAALDDELEVRPGTSIDYPVLSNDSDPDGDPLLLDSTIAASAGADAEVTEEHTIALKVPGDEGVTSVTYTVSDGLGGSSTATLTVKASKDAPLYAPTTRDDVVPADQIVGKSAGDKATVDVLDNDGDLDGSKDDLSLFAAAEGTSVSGTKLQITLKSGPQVVAYRVEDRDHNPAYGIVYVAGTDHVPPTLNPDEVPVEATAGQPVTIDLKKVVRVRSGRSPKIVNAASISTDNGTASADGESAIEFKAPPTSYGPMSVTVDVHDGDTLNDPTGLSAQLTIPIDVTPAMNIAPAVRSANVEVASNDKNSYVELDLKKLATDPNKRDDLSYTLTGQSNGVDGEIRGDKVRVWADGATVGERVALTLKASDGKASATGQIAVLVTATKAPLMTLQSQQKEGQVGRSIEFDLKESIVRDPFPDEDKKPVLKTSDCGCASIKGTTLTVTPKEHGTFTITYTMPDGSTDSSRDVIGQVKAIVADKPDAPGTPSVSEAGPSSVRLTWMAPTDNGKSVTAYHLKWNGGSKDVGQVESAVVDGLNPGDKYQFTVAAENEVGTGKDSPKSSPVTPDKVPGQVASLQVLPEYDDRNGQLHVKWTPAPNEGSAITHYYLTVAGGIGSGVKDLGGTVTDTVVTGLQNGTDYTFTVMAENARGKGPDSAPTSAEHPFTKPGLVQNVALSIDNSNRTGGTDKATVTWDAPADDGGDQPLSYNVDFVDATSGTVISPKHGVTGRSEVFDVPQGTAVKVRVVAYNRHSAVTGDAVTSANAVLSFNQPGAPTIAGTSGVSAELDNQTVSAQQPADDGGSKLTSYEYQTDESSTWKSVPVASSVSVDFTKGHYDTDKQAVRLRACSMPNGSKVCGDADDSGKVFWPWTKPSSVQSLSGSSNDYYSINFSWTPPQSDGGRQVTSYKVNGVSQPGTSYQKIVDQGGASFDVSVVAVTSVSQSPVETKGAVSKPKDVTQSIRDYGSRDPDGPCTSNCDAVTVQVHGFQKGQTQADYDTNADHSTGGHVSGKLDLDGNGNGSKDWLYYDRTVYKKETYCIGFPAYGSPPNSCIQGNG